MQVWCSRQVLWRRRLELYSGKMDLAVGGWLPSPLVSLREATRLLNPQILKMRFKAEFVTVSQDARENSVSANRKMPCVPPNAVLE